MRYGFTAESRSRGDKRGEHHGNSPRVPLCLRVSAVNGHLHAPTDPLLGLRLFVFAALALRLEAFLAALGAVGGALHQLAAHQFKHRLLGAIALAWSKTDDPGIAAVALPETRT